MKRIILSTIIAISISSIAVAQTSGSDSSKSKSSPVVKTKNSKSKKGKMVQTDSLNDRKIYNWKDGQRATPTGHDATGTGGGYAALKKDTVTAPRDSTKQ